MEAIRSLHYLFLKEFIHRQRIRLVYSLVQARGIVPECNDKAVVGKYIILLLEVQSKKVVLTLYFNIFLIFSFSLASSNRFKQ